MARDKTKAYSELFRIKNTMLTDSPLNIMLAVMPQSPFNRSIWTGFLNGFQALGHSVQIADAARMPAPTDISNPLDLLFSVHGGHTPAHCINAYKAAGITTAVYLLDEPYVVDRSVEWSRHYNFVFSVDRVTLPVHRQFTHADFLPLSYNAGIFKPMGSMIQSDILVLGSPYNAREQYLTTLRDHWGQHVTWVGPGWKKFSRLGRHVDQYVSPEDCARFYRGTEISINIHRDSYWSHIGECNKGRLQATHLNPRFWETAACNSLQLCSYRADIDDFAPNTPTFESVDTFCEKVDYFMTHQKSRHDIAKHVYRSVKGHSYKDRCISVLSTIYP